MKNIVLQLVLMENITLENKVNIFHNIFLVSIACALCGIVISIILFFLFDIPQIIGIKTGHIQKRAIEVMREQQKANKGLKENRIINREFIFKEERQETDLLEDNYYHKEDMSKIKFVVRKSVEIFHSNEEIV
ncbi:MAG: hypothetical protein HDR01_07680 [Lachnospiraceae bacterium]|nr:hypothetical protein [Lachnospiraceae bacterium]